MESIQSKTSTEEAINPSQRNVVTHQCIVCPKKFFRKGHLKRHMDIHAKSQEEVVQKCTECQKTFSRKDNLKRHLKMHTKKRLTSFIPEYGQQKGEGSSNRYTYLSPPTKSSCLNTFFTYTSAPKEAVAYDLDIFLNTAKDEIANIIKEATLEHRGIKWYINVKVSFTRDVSSGAEERCIGNFRSNCVSNLIAELPLNNVEQAIEKVKQSYDEFQGRGSGWVLERIHYLETKIAVYVPTSKSTKK